MNDQPESADTVELGEGRRFRRPDWWRPPRPGLIAVAALVVGLAAGYGVGVTRGRAPAAPAPAKTGSGSASSMSASSVAASAVPAPGASFSFDATPALTEGTAECSVQSGRRLQLGVQVSNSSPVPVTLEAIKAVLPLGGLKQVASQWGTCGALASAPEPDAVVLPAGESAWLTVTFEVSVSCPGASPVQFSVGYLANSVRATAQLPGFSDLGQVPYSGCGASGR